MGVEWCWMAGEQKGDKYEGLWVGAQKNAGPSSSIPADHNGQAEPPMSQTAGTLRQLALTHNTGVLPCSPPCKPSLQHHSPQSGQKGFCNFDAEFFLRFYFFS